MKALLLCGLLLLCVGCVMPSDIRDLKMATYQLKEGSITKHQFNDRLEAKAAEIEKRTQDAIDAIESGLTLAETGGIGGVITLGGGLLLNLLRNNTRKKNLAELTEEGRRQDEMHAIRQGLAGPATVDA